MNSQPWVEIMAVSGTLFYFSTRNRPLAPIVPTFNHLPALFRGSIF